MALSCYLFVLLFMLIAKAKGNVRLTTIKMSLALDSSQQQTNYLLSLHPDIISSVKSRLESTFEQSRQSFSDGDIVSV